MPSHVRLSNSRIPSLALSAALLLPLVAQANGEWEWESEFQSRIWRTGSLNWASDIHPQHPTPATLQSTEAPPPREQWCTKAPSPTEADCDEFDYRLRHWIADYLNIYAINVTYAQMASFPNECSSLCAY